MTVLLAQGLCLGCVALTEEPWSRFREGANTVELSTGVSEQHITYSLAAESAYLEGEELSRSEDLRGEYAIGVRAATYLTDAWNVGGGLEWWRHKSSAVDFGPFAFTSEPFGSMRYVLNSRYLFPALGMGVRSQRLRPFVGLELFYVADLDADLQAEYAGAPGQTEALRFEGHGYYGYTLGSGLVCLVADDTWLELGGRWSQNFNPSEDELLLNPPGEDPARFEAELDPEGWSIYVALTYSF